MSELVQVCTYPACQCRATGVYCDNKPVKKQPQPIAKQSEKQKKKAADLAIVSRADISFYYTVWMERPRVDFETGEPIYERYNSLFMHHILQKKQTVHAHSDYSIYRHCKWNIVIISWQTHDKVHMNIENCPKIKAYTLKLVKMHDEGKLANVSPDVQYIE